MKPGLRRGQLTKWKDERGFGFIQPVDGSQEVFLHISELKEATRRPLVGDTVYYHLKVQDGKTRASDAFIAGARKPRSPAASVHTASSSRNNAGFILEALLLSILPMAGSLHFAWTTQNPLPLILYAVMSGITFVLYADDKSRAKRGDRRISERTLHLCELGGGWIGGFIAQRKIRHKNKKRSYQTTFWAIVALHLAFWMDWLFLRGLLLKAIFRQAA